MRNKLSILGLALVLGALIVSACVPAAADLADSPVVVSTAVPPEEPIDGEYVEALDVILAYLSERYGQEAPSLELAWTEENITPGYPDKPVPGSVTLRYTADAWVVTVDYAVLPLERTSYQVVVVNQATGFQWQGEVDAAGQVTETVVPTGGQPVVGWGGFVIGLPSGVQFDDYLALEPEGAGAIGLTGADNTVEAQIQMLRDSNTYVHFWGTLNCPVLDYGGCQLVVSRLRKDRPGPSFDPDPVEGWEGIIASFPPGSQFDDYFILAGDFPVGYGIDSLDPTLAAQLAGLRDTGTAIRVWGELVCPTVNAYGTGIVVSRIEIVGEPPAPSPTPPPSPTPKRVVEEPVDGWGGTIVQLLPGSQHKDYFERDDGQRYGIEGADDTVREQIEEYRWTGA